MGNIATEMTVFRAFEGPQLVMQWTNPDDAGLEEVQIRRGLGDFPQAITDGSQVYQDLTPTPSDDKYFSDLNVDGQTTYYYTIFTKVSGTWYYDVTTQNNEIALDNSDYHLRLWNALPEIYRREDANTEQKVLQIQQGADGQWWNFNEDQTQTYGQLYRFLKLYGLYLGNSRELIKYYQKFYDIYNVSSDFLPYLSNMIGLALVSGISLQRQRFILANAVAIYKIRGTLAGILQFAEGNFRTTPILVEFGQNVLESDRLDRTSASDDPIALANWGSPYDTFDRTVDGRNQSPGEEDGRWSYRTFGLFFDDVLDTDITPGMIQSAEEYFRDFIPGTSHWMAFVHWDSYWEDDFLNPALPGWNKTDPGNWLSVSGSNIIYNHISGIAIAQAKLTRPGWSIPTEIALEMDVHDLNFPIGIPSSDAFVQIILYFSPTSYGLIRMRYRWLISELSIEAVKSEAVGGALSVGKVVLPFTVTNANFRIERGPNGLLRFLYKIGDDPSWNLLGQYRSSYYAGGAFSEFVLWWDTPAANAFHVETDAVRFWESTTGWVQVYP